MAAVTLDLEFEQEDNGETLDIVDVSEYFGAVGYTQVTAISEIAITVAYKAYDDTAPTTYGTATYTVTPTDLTERADLAYVLQIDTSNQYLQIDFPSYNGTTTQSLIDASYTDTILKDGLWYITYSITTDGGVDDPDDQDFTVFLDYECTKEVYDLGEALPDTFKQDEIEYNEDVEKFLLNFAFLKALQFSAATGQEELLEELHETLENLYS